MTDPVTAPTPDDLARGWVEKNLPALRPTDGSYRQPVALCMQDAFRAGFATAVARDMWVVERCLRYDSQSLVGIFTRREDAIAQVPAGFAEISPGYWESEDEVMTVTARRLDTLYMQGGEPIPPTPISRLAG